MREKANVSLNIAKIEYKKYQVKELSPIEKEYLKSINDINKISNKIKEGV